MIGILNVYFFDRTINNPKGIYNQLIHDFAKKTFPGEEICDYEIAFGQWPKSIDECRAWIITGSAKGVYDKDEWIAQLKKFIKELHQNKKKLFGICFGHQIIADALGGRVEKSEKGWGLGVKDFRLIKEQSWMKPAKNEISLLFSHQDQVIEIPQEAVLLATNDFCPNQMFQIGSHILTVQGHPEYNAEYCKEKLNKHHGAISEEVFQEALKSFEKTPDNEILSDWFREFAELK